MSTRANSGSKRNNNNKQNTIEVLRDFSTSMAQNTASEVSKIGTGMFDQLLGISHEDKGHDSHEKAQKSPEHKGGAAFKQNEFVSLFNFQKEQEVRTIKELIDQIRNEIKMLKKADSALMSEVRDIENIGVEAMPDKPGIYHIRFLELVLNIIKTLRLKIGESRTWMEALTSKKKKRGSLFASMSKKKGTQYSMSQELSNARSIQ